MKQRQKSISKIESFKRWSRKSYSVYNSIGKTVKIGVLTLCCCIVAIPAKTKAQHQDTSTVEKTLEIEEITITADRTPIDLSRTTKTITIITSDDLKRQPILGLEQALRMVASVDARQRGGLGVQTDISIRGGHYEQTMVLLNGVCFNDPQTGHFNFNLPIDFESVDKIEVIQGSATRLYGINSMSGAVNIIVDPEKSNYLKFSLLGGDFGLYKLGIKANFYKHNFTHYFSLNRFSSSGYVKNTDFIQNNGYYFGKFENKVINVDYQAGYNQRQFGANGFYSPKFPNQFEANNTILASIKLETKTRFVVSPKIYWRMNNDRFELFRGMTDAPSWYKNHNFHQTQTYGASLNSWVQTKFGKSTIGADYRSESIHSNVLGELLSDTLPIKGQDFGYTRGHKREYTSFFIDHAYYHKYFNLSAGLMTNYNSDLNKWLFFPGMDANVLFWKHFSVFASINTSLRMPTFTDLYYKSATLIGNENLNAEEALTYEAGGKYITKNLQVQVSVFERQGKNLIDWIKYPSDTLWRSENLTNLTFKGVEISTSILPFTFLQALNIFKKITFSYTYIQIDKPNQGFQSTYVLDNLKHKFVMSSTFGLTKNLLLTYKYSYQQRNGQFLKYENGIAMGLESNKPFSLSDVRLMWEAKKWNAFIEVANVFNTDYFDFGNIFQPGRWTTIGFNYRIDL